jgi:hypothetical protein
VPTFAPCAIASALLAPPSNSARATSEPRHEPTKAAVFTAVDRVEKRDEGVERVAVEREHRFERRRRAPCEREPCEAEERSLRVAFEPAAEPAPLCEFRSAATVETSGEPDPLAEGSTRAEDPVTHGDATSIGATRPFPLSWKGVLDHLREPGSEAFSGVLSSIATRVAFVSDPAETLSTGFRRFP